MTSFIEIIDKLDLTVVDNIDDDQPTNYDNNDDVNISQTQNENETGARLDLEKIHSIQQEIILNLYIRNRKVQIKSVHIVKGFFSFS